MKVIKLLRPVLYFAVFFLLFQASHLYLTNTFITFVIPNSYADSLAATKYNLYMERSQKLAYDYAYKCSMMFKRPRPILKYDEIKWKYVNEKDIFYYGADKVVLRGFFNVPDSTIYIPKNYSWDYTVLAHEALHALGFDGHPDIPFKNPCRLTE